MYNKNPVISNSNQCFINAQGKILFYSHSRINRPGSKYKSLINLTGNGDILSYEDLDRHIKETQVKGCMIARFDYFFGSPDLKGSHELLPSLAVPARHRLLLSSINY
jgi:hypothetical protein